MWTLFALTQDLKVQRKLREELLRVSNDNPSMDELQALPYLDMVLKEVLRFHSPVPMTMRVAVEDDVVPLNTPFVDRNGVTRDTIRLVLVRIFAKAGHPTDALSLLQHQ